MSTHPKTFLSMVLGRNLHWLCGILALAVLSHAVAATGAQKTGATQNRSGTSSKAPSPFQEAETLLTQGQVPAAIEKIQEQLKLHPSSVAGYNLLGIAFSSEKNYTGALEAFQQALKLDPNSARTLNNLGRLYVTQGKNDLGEKEFRRVLSLEPENRDGNYNLGVLLLANG